MSAVIIDGLQIAQKIRLQLKERTTTLLKKNVCPCLAVVLIGEDPASLSYVFAKRKALVEAGMLDKQIHLPLKISERALLSVIAQLNEDPLVHGILVQLPLPKHIDEFKIISAILPQKDVDGFHPENSGNMIIGKKTFLPCTPNGIIRLLHEMNIATSGKHAVIVGRSHIVGTPLSILLSRKENNATVTLCHSATKNVQDFTLQADILISAIGKPAFISGEMIKKNAVVIDVGVNRVADETKKNGCRLVGDVDFSSALEVASFITPVPKGVGPMTITMLMENILQAAENAP